MVWILVWVMVWLEAPVSGTSLNPARSFGPALVSWLWHDHWLYRGAPPLGALLAAGAFRLLAIGERDVLTSKLFHVPHIGACLETSAHPVSPPMGGSEDKIGVSIFLIHCDLSGQ